MDLIWRAFYNTIVVPALFVGFHIGARFNEKTREGIAGRRDVFTNLKSQLESSREIEPNGLVSFHLRWRIRASQTANRSR